jgi:hypothetical protein
MTLPAKRAIANVVADWGVQTQASSRFEPENGPCICKVTQVTRLIFRAGEGDFDLGNLSGE